MTSKEAIDKIKELFKFADTPGAPAAPPADGSSGGSNAAPATTSYQTADGQTLVVTGDLAAGSAVSLNGAPAPDADYTLADGTVISIAGGVISNIVAVDTTEQDMQKMKEDLNKFATDPAVTGNPQLSTMSTLVKALFENVFGWQLQQQQADQAIALYKSNFSKQEKENKDLKEQLTALKKQHEEFVAQQKEFVGKVNEGFKLISEMPADEPVQKPKNAFRSDMSDKHEARLKRISEALHKLHEN